MTFTPELEISQFTSAPLQLEGTFIFDAPADVLFQHISDPNNMSAWFPTMHQGSVDHAVSETDGEWGVGSKRYCQTRLMGTLNETILHWEPPHVYAYNVQNWTMPIKDHCAVMRVESLGENRSQLIWQQYYNPIGLFLKYAFPDLMVTMMNAGMEQLRQTLGGSGGKMRKVN